MEIRFDGKRALVTGAGKGIGRQIAIALAKSGAETIALSRTQEDLDSLKQQHPNIKAVCVDLSDWDATRRCTEVIGAVDLLVNNAGVGSAGLFVEVPREEVDRVLDIDFKAIINVSQVVVKGMQRRSEGGAIVNLSSIYAQRVCPGSSMYSATKAAVEMLTKSMALELGPHKIRVNCVSPTFTWTPMTTEAMSDPSFCKAILPRIPTGRFAVVEDVANMVIFLLSEKAAMTTGSIVPVDGGHLIT